MTTTIDLAVETMEQLEAGDITPQEALRMLTQPYRAALDAEKEAGQHKDQLRSHIERVLQIGKIDKAQTDLFIFEQIGAGTTESFPAKNVHVFITQQRQAILASAANYLREIAISDPDLRTRFERIIESVESAPLHIPTVVDRINTALAIPELAEVYPDITDVREWLKQHPTWELLDSFAGLAQVSTRKAYIKISEVREKK